MSENDRNELNDLADAMWILSHTQQALQEARQRLRQMQRGRQEARSWLALVEGFQQARLEGLDRHGQGQGQTLGAFAQACEDAVEAGRGAERRIARAVANLKAAVVMVDGMRAGNFREEIAGVRLRRELMSLQDELERARPVLGRVSDRLQAEAERARQDARRPHERPSDAAVERVCGVLLDAAHGASRVDEHLQRVQVLTARATRATDAISEVARARMRAHRETTPRHLHRSTSTAVAVWTRT